MSAIPKDIKPVKTDKLDQPDAEDFASLIGIVLDLEYQRYKKLEDPSLITMKRNQADRSNWGVIHKMRSLGM